MKYDFDSLWELELSDSIIKFDENTLTEQLSKGWEINQPLIRYALQGIEKFPVMLAIQYNNWESVGFLINQGAQLDIGDSHAFLYAVRHSDAEMVKYVVKKGARVKVKEKIWNAYDLAIFQKKIELLPVIRELGLPVNPYGSRSLYTSIYQNDYSSIEALIHEGIDLNCNKVYEWNGMGDTSVGYAATYSDINMIEYLMKKGGDPIIKNKFGEIPYVMAHSAGNYDNAEFLSKFGNPDMEEIKEELPENITDYLKKNERKVALTDCIVDYFIFLSVQNLYYSYIKKQKIIVLTQEVGNYPDLYLGWNPKKNSMVYYDKEHGTYDSLKVDFDEFIEKPAEHINKIFYVN